MHPLYTRVLKWLRKQRSKYDLWYSQLWHPDNTGQQEKLSKVKALDPLLFSDYSNFRGRVFEIESIYNHFDTLLADMTFLKHSLRAQSKIELTWCKYDYRTVTLEQFLIASDDSRLDPVSSIRVFKQLALDFLQLYFDLDKGVTAYDPYHKRILTNYEKVVLKLTDDLLRYSHV